MTIVIIIFSTLLAAGTYKVIRTLFISKSEKVVEKYGQSVSETFMKKFTMALACWFVWFFILKAFLA